MTAFSFAFTETEHKENCIIFSYVVNKAKLL